MEEEEWRKGERNSWKSLMGNDGLEIGMEISGLLGGLARDANER